MDVELVLRLMLGVAGSVLVLVGILLVVGTSIYALMTASAQPVALTGAPLVYFGGRLLIVAVALNGERSIKWGRLSLTTSEKAPPQASPTKAA